MRTSLLVTAKICQKGSIRGHSGTNQANGLHSFHPVRCAKDELPQGSGNRIWNRSVGVHSHADCDDALVVWKGYHSSQQGRTTGAGGKDGGVFQPDGFYKPLRPNASVVLADHHRPVLRRILDVRVFAEKMNRTTVPRALSEMRVHPRLRADCLNDKSMRSTGCCTGCT